VGEKITLNQPPKGERALEKAFPVMEKALSAANLQYGGGSLTRLEPLTKWLPQIVEEVVLGIKEYFASVDLVPYQQLCQHFAEKPAHLLK
jgi:hypothetical protein